MKKFVTFILSILIIISFSYITSYGECSYSDGSSVGNNLDSCLSDSRLVNGTDVNIEAGGNFGKKIKDITNSIALYLGIFAVGSIVFGSLMLTLSAGEEEKIKKAKDVIKWGIFGFIGVISASAIINIVIKVMYSI